MSVGIYNGGLRGHCLRIKKDHVVCVCARAGERSISCRCFPHLVIPLFRQSAHDSYRRHFMNKRP